MVRVITLSLLCIAAALAGQAATPTAPTLHSTPPVESATAAPLKIVVANPVAADLVRGLGGKDLALVVLGAGGGDPHHYEPTPADAQQIASADLVVQFGLGLDRPLAKLHASTASRGTLLVIADGLAKAASAGAAGVHAHDHAHDHDSAGSVDPHIWHDPSKVQVLNQRLCEALVALRPQSVDAFRARSLALDGELVKLDTWIKSQVQTIAPEKRVLVTTHDGLSYFADRYGFRVVGVEMMGGGVSQSDPSPQELIKMVREVQATKCGVVLGDAAHPSRVAATVAREAKVRLVETLQLDGLLQPPAVEPGKAYLETMRANVKAIVKALNE